MAAAERRLSFSETGAPDDDDFDTLLSSLGFGRWQSWTIAMAFIISGLLPTQVRGVVLFASSLPFRCHANASFSPGNVSALTTNSSLLETSEASYANATYYNEQCLPPRDYDDAYLLGNDSQHLLDGSSPAISNNTAFTDLPSCPFIEYDTSVFSSSVASDYHLVCESYYQQALFQITYHIGGIMGSIIGGYIGDKWGRRTAVQLGSMLFLGSVLLMVFVPSYTVTLLMRLVVGYATQSSFVTGWNMMVEGFPLKHRSLVGMLVGLSYSIFTVHLAVAAYLIRSWKNLVLVSTVPLLIQIPLSFYVDESPRWLLQQGKSKRALVVLKRAVKLNKVKLNVDLPSTVEKIVQRNKRMLPSEPGEDASMPSNWKFSLQQLSEYVRSPGMRIILIVTPIIWFLQSSVYLGVVLNADNFASDNPFLYVGLLGLMDGCSVLLSALATPYLGYRVMIGTESFTGGVLLLLELIVPAYYTWIRWTMVMVGFLLLAGAFKINFVYTPELLPTQARTRGFALDTTVGSLGFMCAPLVTTFLAKHSEWFPGVVFGCSGILTSLLVTMLPETNKKPLPETLLDVEIRYREGKKSKPSGIDNLAYNHDTYSNGTVSSVN